MAHYAVTIRTGVRNHGGTDAPVLVTLVGDKGETNQQDFDKPKYDDFERGDEDTYEFNDQDIGYPERVKVEGDGWWCDWIKVRTSEHPGREFFFRAGRWFSADEEQGKYGTLTEQGFVNTRWTEIAGHPLKTIPIGREIQLFDLRGFQNDIVLKRTFAIVNAIAQEHTEGNTKSNSFGTRLNAKYEVEPLKLEAEVSASITKTANEEDMRSESVTTTQTSELSTTLPQGKLTVFIVDWTLQVIPGNIIRGYRKIQHDKPFRYQNTTSAFSVTMVEELSPELLTSIEKRLIEPEVPSESTQLLN